MNSKKITSVIIALLLIVSVFSISATAADTITVSVSSVNVNAGDVFPVQLMISENSQMSGAVIDINYDKAQLEFVSADSGAILNKDAQVSINNIDGEKGCVRFAYMDASSNVTAGGALANIQFRALENSQGKTELSVSISNAGDFVRNDLSKIAYNTENGVINIINTTYVAEGDTTDATDSEIEEEGSNTVSDIEQQTTQNSTERNNDSDGNANKIKPVTAISVAGVIVVAIVTFFVLRKRMKNKNNK